MVRKVISTIYDIYNRCIGSLAFLAGVLIIVIMLSVFVDVTLRYFLNRPIVWVLEASEYTLVYVTFLGTAWLLSKDGHVKVDIIVSALKPRAQTYLNLATSVLMVIICGLLVWYGTQTTLSHFHRHIMSLKYFSTPKFALLAIIPAGSLLLLIESVRRAYGYFQLIKKKKDNRHSLQNVSGSKE